jgi:hypothetical protein
MRRADGIYSELKAIFEDVLHAKSGRQSIPPERGRSAKRRCGCSRATSSFKSRSGNRKKIVEAFSTDRARAEWAEVLAQCCSRLDIIQST